MVTLRELRSGMAAAPAPPPETPPPAFAPPVSARAAPVAAPASAERIGADDAESMLRSLLLEMQQHRVDAAYKSNVMLAVFGVIAVFLFVTLERLQSQVRSLEMALVRRP